jgi:spore coat protein SA
MPIRSVAPKSKITLSMHNDMFNLDKIDPDEANAVIKEVSAIVTVSKYVGDVIRKLYPKASSKIRPIYSGVDTERFLPGSYPEMQKIRSEIRKKHGLENKTVLLFAGRLSENKGVDRLVRALPQLSKKFKNLALVIVGSRWFSQEDITTYIAYVKALAKKQPVPVVATGFVHPDKIQNWFAAADLFICTSIWQEPLARVHYEAMAAGLPIVTTARGGNPEVISSGENGLIVENPEDPSGFADKITEILSDKSLMRKMGKKGRKLAVSNYKWNRVANEILEVWEHSIQNKSKYSEVLDARSYGRHSDSRSNRRRSDSRSNRRRSDSRSNRRRSDSRSNRRRSDSRSYRRRSDSRSNRRRSDSRSNRRRSDSRSYRRRSDSRSNRRRSDSRSNRRHSDSRSNRRRSDSRSYRRRSDSRSYRRDSTKKKKNYRTRNRAR